MKSSSNPEIRVPPFWSIVSQGTPSTEGAKPIVLSDGAGWGNGAHETTQLCLQAIGLLHPRKEIRVLDFGSGSGILSIAAAKLGAAVDGVEIDDAANETARTNARLNGVSDRTEFTREIGPATYDWVIANILRPVLMDFAERLVQVLKPGGTLILSGIVSTDLPSLTVRYSGLLGGRAPEVFRRGEWCCLVWR